MIKLYQGDCLEIMPLLNLKFDAIITDIPYGLTACKWDEIISFINMWNEINKLRKNKTPVILFGSEPFSSKLRCSNIEEFKYDWIWEKEQGVNFQLVKYQPLKIHEIISVFYNHNYYPQDLIKCNIKKSNKFKGGNLNHCSSELKRKEYKQEFTNYPISIKKFNRERGLHPTQKPVTLLEYLIKTYTQENDLILDFTAGSGTTGKACQNLNRNCILIEKEEKYCEIIEQRLNIKRESFLNKNIQEAS